MVKLENFLSKYIWILIILLSAPAVWALLVPGFYGASDDMHIAWLYEMDKTLKLGQFPPRFVPDLSFGFGYPLFNFVFPLPFYIAEIIHLTGFNLVDSIKGVFLLGLPFSMFFMYRLLREFGGGAVSLAGAVIYGFTPYRSTDIYVRGAFGESLAFVFLPLIALSVVKLCQNYTSFKRLRWIGIGGLAFAGLTLTHNITAFMFLPFIALLAAIEMIFLKNNRKQALLPLLLMGALGLLVSIYFWLPAILDSKLMVYDTVFNYVDHFPTLRQLLIPNFGYGSSVPGPGDGMSFFIGTVNLVVFVLGVFCLVYFWQKFSINQKILLIWASITFLSAFIMMNNRSLFLWQQVPLVPYFQFPWRFLIITTFITPIFIIALGKIKYGTFLSVVFVGATVLLNAGFFKPHDFLGRTDDYYLNRYIPVPFASEEYLKTQEEYLRLPLSTTKRPDRNFPLISLQGEGRAGSTVTDGLNTEFKVESSKELLLSYNKYYFPGWKASVDGQETVIQPGLPYGQINLAVPSGSHLVRVYFEATPFKKILDVISLLGSLTAVILAVRPNLAGFKPPGKYKNE